MPLGGANSAQIGGAPGRIRTFSIWPTAGELRTMINLIVIAISVIMFALLLVWWRWRPSAFGLRRRNNPCSDRNAASIEHSADSCAADAESFFGCPGVVWCVSAYPSK